MQNEKLNNNKWHNTEYPDNILKAGYVEWKYFNFISQNYSGIFVYLMMDPLNITGLGGGRVIARIFTKDEAFGKSDKFLTSEILSSEKSAQITIGNNDIFVIGDKYQIKGGNEFVEWDLQYSPTLSPLEGFTNIALDPFNLEKASWFVKMPKAEVNGLIKINGKKTDINAVGYSDANWGNLSVLTSQFNWGQYNDEKISIVFGETYNIEIAKIKFGERWSGMHVVYDNKQILFSENQLTIKDLEWNYVSKSKTKIPFITKVEAENNDYKISFLMKTIMCDPIRFKMPFSFLIKTIVVEQIAKFNGNLFKKENGKNIPICPINGTGFKEYTSRDISVGDSDKIGILV
jgi:hypothetical protein